MHGVGVAAVLGCVGLLLWAGIMDSTCQRLSRCYARAGRLGAKLGASRDCTTCLPVTHLYTT